MRLLTIILFSVLTVECNKSTPLDFTTEQAVYETLFAERIGNTYSKYYIASATESEWFSVNPVETSRWETSLDDLGSISMDLVEELYRVNKESHPLQWQPIVTNAKLLPTSFAQKSNVEERDIRCLVKKGEGNIGLYGKRGKGEFRSYYTVSKVAFSRNRRKALVKYSYHCAPLSGAGEFFVTFEFKDNRWQLIGGRTLWVS